MIPESPNEGVFKIYDESESPNEGDVIKIDDSGIKICDVPESPNEGACLRYVSVEDM